MMMRDTFRPHITLYIYIYMNGRVYEVTNNFQSIPFYSL